MNRILVPALTLAMGFVLVSSASSATTSIYVNGTTGSDYDDGSLASPVKTIQRGIVLANAAINEDIDAVVHIAAGSYGEVVNIDWSVTNTVRSLILECEPGTILTGADQWNTG